MTVESNEKHEPIEVVRTPTGLVNEICVYSDEAYDDVEKIWRYSLRIIRIGGRAMTDEEVAEIAAPYRR